MKTICAIAALLALGCSKPGNAPETDPVPPAAESPPPEPDRGPEPDPEPAQAEPEPEPPEPGDPSDRVSSEACDSDGDCVMSTFAGCCDCCGCTAEPYAIHQKELDAKRGFCARVRCNMSRCADVDCAPCPDEPPAAAAVCRKGRCVAR